MKGAPDSPSRETAPARPARLRPRLRPLASSIGRIWLVTVVTAAGAAYISARVVQDVGPFTAGEPRIPWWALALVFAFFELCAIHLEFRRESHTFTLSGLPLVVGLIFATPAAVLVGRLLGTGARLAHERRRPVKVGFGLSRVALETAAALVVLDTIAHGADPFGPVGIGGMFAATLAGTLVGVALTFVLISISELSLERRQLGTAAAIGAAVTAANTGIAVVAAQALAYRLTFGLLLAVPAVIVFVAYRSLVRAREKHGRLEFLHETSSLITRSPKLETGIREVLALTCSMFHAEVAEIVLVPTEGTQRGLRAVAGPGGKQATLEEVDLSDDDLSSRVLTERRPLLLRRRDEDAALRTHLPGCELRDAAIVPLKAKTKVLGTLLVGNRLGDVRTFSEHDLELVETLASKLGAALENAQLGQTLGRLTELSEQLEHQAFHDPLTGLANRALFTERLEQAVVRQKTAGGLLAVLFVDIDDFKAVNDLRGHEAGDELLAAVGRRLPGCLREIDTCARLGGDEFAILLERFASDYEAEIVAQRIVDVFQQPFRVGGEPVTVSASVGVALSDGTSSQDGTGILSDADVAMYRAKAQGKAQFTVFEPSMRAELFRPIEVRGNLRLALTQNELAVHYQPIVSLSTGELEGVEALLRWNSARGFIPPSEFVPIAEETGLIEEIGAWVLQEACRKPRAWRSEGGKASVWISVNISRRQLERPLFVDVVAEALREARLDPGLLVLEITESVAALDDAAVITSLRALKGLGVRLALDDFGSGYSSIGLLQALPLDLLKLDRQFVDKIGTDPKSTQLTRTIVDLARTFGLETIAEGVERGDQLDVLVSLGCDFAQGYLFAEPLEAHGIQALLNQQAPGRWPTSGSEQAGRLRALEGGRRSA